MLYTLPVVAEQVEYVQHRRQEVSADPGVVDAAADFPMDQLPVLAVLELVEVEVVVTIGLD
jgi:hypothetical protein